jgi:hypothetical protein
VYLHLTAVAGSGLGNEGSGPPPMIRWKGMATMTLVPTAALYHHSCRRKVRHPSRGKADAAARSLNKLHGNQRFESYPCPACGGFHVGRRKGR